MLSVHQERFAVIGNPILHSKSPDLFNALFRYHRIEANYTLILPVDEFSIDELFQWLNLSFLNVTTPYKERYFCELENVSAEAKIVEAVNTVIKTPDGLLGINTDGEGVLGALCEAIDDFHGKNALIFGAGPAARSAAYALKSKGAEVWITNRTNEKALRLADTMGLNYLPFELEKWDLSRFDILVLATLPGFNPFNDAVIKPGAVVLNANYRKNSVDLSSQQLRTIGGERWLLHQACAAFESYFGVIPDKEIMEQVLINSSTDRSWNSVILDYSQPLFSFDTIDLLVAHRNNFEKAKEMLKQEENLLNHTL